MEERTIEKAIHEGHVDTEQLHDRLAVEELERPNERLGEYLLPGPVRVVELGANNPRAAFLGVACELFAQLRRLALE